MRKLLIASLTLVISLLTACSPLPEGTVSQRETAAVAAMEKAGALPELDRSASLGGVDADHNGIRDDIDAWIAGQHYSEPQKKAAQQYAQALQLEMVLPIKTREEARKNAVHSDRAIDCFFHVDEKNAYEIMAKLDKLAINTRERILKESQRDSLLSGMVFKPLPWETACE